MYLQVSDEAFRWVHHFKSRATTGEPPSMTPTRASPCWKWWTNRKASSETCKYIAVVQKRTTKLYAAYNSLIFFRSTYRFRVSDLLSDCISDRGRTAGRPKVYLHERKEPADILVVNVNGVVLGDVRRKDGAVASRHPVTLLRFPVTQMVETVVRVHQTVLCDVVFAGKHGHYVFWGSVFLQNTFQSALIPALLYFAWPPDFAVR